MNLSDFHWSDVITKVVAAIIILVITAVIAKVLKKVLSKQLGRVKALQRASDGGGTLADSLGSIGSLIVWLFGLMAVLNLFALTQVVTPIQSMLNSILGALPNILGAAIVMFIGFVLAKIARELVVTALQAAHADRFMERIEQRSADPTGLHAETEPFSDGTNPSLGRRYDADTTSGGTSTSSMAGQLVFAVILIVVAIAALQVLDIKSISQPASHMLQVLLDAIPLVIGGVIAKFAGNLVESLLRGMDTGKALSNLGIDPQRTDVPKIAARMVQIAIVLFFAIAAANVLHIPQMTQILNTVLNLGGRVVFGAAVIVAGVFIAGLLAKIVGGRTGDIVKVATIVLFAAVGLRYMGLANSIINLAFGAVVIGGAAAAAIAFGLGGRDAAARQLERIQQGRNDSTPSQL